MEKITIIILLLSISFYMCVPEKSKGCTKKPEDDKNVQINFKILKKDKSQGDKNHWLIGEDSLGVLREICYAKYVVNLSKSSNIEPVQFSQYKDPHDIFEIAEAGDRIFKAEGTLKYQLLKKDTLIFFFVFDKNGFRL